jgi:putative ABC transport system ATP-binding protein
MAAALIHTEKLTKTYYRGRADELRAVSEVTLTIPENRVIVLQGPSGSGKSTLLSLIGCMSRPTSGLVTVGGHDVSRLPERRLAEIRRRLFGFIFQQLHLIRKLTVLENVMLPLYPSPTGFAAMKFQAQATLESLSLWHKRQQRIDHLSGGEQQRVAIARALINDPRIVIADEPTAHLDSKLGMELLAIFSDLKTRGKTIIIATHDPFVVHHEAVDLTFSMHDGRLLGESGA